MKLFGIKISEKGEGEIELLMVLVFFVIIFVITMGKATVGWFTQRTFEGVAQKTVVDRGNTYFVILGDGETTPVTYENEDAWFFFKWNSGDVLRDLNAGQRYTFHTYGWRVPFLSWYPNVISITPLDQ